ncbi:MAG: cobyric acid synthase CobQ, partial [Candidatus Contubernalis sp.]|nr:cobyric acid synthase CobQ [Candidatus Contubernalis sp.]
SGRGISINDGAVGKKGFVFGTYLHGIFDNENFRHSFLKHLYNNKGLVSSVQGGVSFSQRINQTYDSLADTVRDNIDLDYIKKIAGIK